MHILAYHKEREEEAKREWEIARAVAFSNAKFSGNMKAGSKMEKFWSFAWDQQEVKSTEISPLLRLGHRQLIELNQRKLNGSSK